MDRGVLDLSLYRVYKKPAAIVDIDKIAKILPSFVFNLQLDCKCSPCFF